MTTGVTQAVGITATQAGGGTGGGVSALNGLTGTLSLTSSGATIVITLSGSSINLESSGSAPSFDLIGSGTNTTAAMVVGTGGTLSASGSGSIHATKTDALQTARTINGTSFDGTANIVVPAAAGTLTGTTLASGVTASSLTSVGTLTNLTVTNPIAGSITGNAATVTTNANLTGPVTSVGNVTSLNSSSQAIPSAWVATTQTPGDNSTKLATTAYVAAAILGQDYKEACKYASTAALPSIVYSNGSSGVGATLTGVALAAISLDSSSPSVNDRVLIKNQASSFQNGIYTVTATGSGIAVFVLTRAADFNQSAEIDTGDTVFVTAGATQATTTWAYNGGDQPVIGTDPITFAQTAGQGSFTQGNGIAITGTSIAIDTSVTVDKTTVQTLTNKTLTAPVMTGPVLGTPASGILTNCSALPIGTGLSGATSNQLVTGTVGGGLQAVGVIVSGSNISQYQAVISPAKTDSYTLVSADTGTTLYFTNSSAAILTCPKTMPLGYTVEVLQHGTAQITFTAATSAAVLNRQSQTKTAGQYAAARLVVVLNSDGTNAQYNLAGDTG